jgi:CRP-like cAMP-binding protein
LASNKRRKGAGPACDLHGNVACDTCHGRGHTEWGVLDDTALSVLNKSRQVREYSPGDLIFTQGTPCQGLFCVDSGDIALRKSDDHGASGIVRMARSGQTIGYRALFGGGPYMASAEALTPATVCFIPAPTVRELMERNATLAYRFLKRFADDLRESEEQRLHAQSLSTRARMADYLIRLKDRDGSVAEDGAILLELPLSRTDLAALLGTRRESIARAIRALQDAGVAQFEGRSVRIPDLDALFDELEGPPVT